jgi:hypothetical protein
MRQYQGNRPTAGGFRSTGKYQVFWVLSSGQDHIAENTALRYPREMDASDTSDVGSNRRQIISGGIVLGLSILGLPLFKSIDKKSQERDEVIVQIEVSLKEDCAIPLPAALGSLLAQRKTEHGRYRDLIARNIQLGNILERKIVEKSASKLVIESRWVSMRAYEEYISSTEVRALLCSFPSDLYVREFQVS